MTGHWGHTHQEVQVQYVETVVANFGMFFHVIQTIHFIHVCWYDKNEDMPLCIGAMYKKYTIEENLAEILVLWWF